MHLNVPAENQYRIKLTRRLYWLSIGLFAPELVAYTAWYQRMTAATAFKELQAAVGQKAEPSLVTRLWYWLLELHSVDDSHADSEVTCTPL